jgi:hypothetical protein
MTIQYRKPVPTNQPIKIVGRAIKSKKFSATSVAEIYNSVGDLLVQSEAVLINVPEEIINSVDLDVLGWRVYPD